ncbi:MAG: lytic transglycosylase domain-containing protein [Pseudonocardiaceae bacterium]
MLRLKLAVALLPVGLVLFVVIAVLLLVTAIASFPSSSGAACGATAPSGPLVGPPAYLIPIYKDAAGAAGLGPDGAAVLAAINSVETNFGQDLKRSSKGAIGWMQFEPSTWAQYGQGGDPFNPHDAIFAAARLLAGNRAPDDWHYAILAYNPDELYVAKVESVARQYGATLVATSPGCPGAVTPGTYADPFWHALKVVHGRIDMGVDYSGSGEIDTIGAAKITFAGTGIGGNWTCNTQVNGGIVYQLLDGPDRNRFVYVTEDVAPTVDAGPARIPGGAPIGTFTGDGGLGCIEIGWASGPGQPSPRAAQLNQQSHGGDAGANRTYCGQTMTDLLTSLGAPPGAPDTRPLSGTSC